ncbi:hypothetical protein QPK87_31790 [Kamptonema cortianum]|nr:hypothetical protein [Kamptonema cortianum]
MTSLTDLKAALRKSIHAAKVGLAEPASLEDVYGTVDFEAVDSLVKSISGDPRQLLVCRIMWPAALSRWENLESGTSECQLDPGANPDSAKRNYEGLQSALLAEWTPEFRVWQAHQLSFVYSWILFERSAPQKTLHKR